jgi:hypothetical protein
MDVWEFLWEALRGLTYEFSWEALNYFYDVPLLFLKING